MGKLINRFCTWSLVLGLMAGTAMSLASFDQASAQNKDKFVFALANAVNVTTAPLAFAQELGYFDAENLELQQPFPILIGSAIIIPQLMNGSIDSAFMAPESLIVSKQPGGPNFDYKYVYNYARGSVYEIVVLEDSPIKTVADLAGKTLGVGGLTWGNVASTKGILVSEGVSLDSVNFAAVGDGAAALEALKSGQIAALNMYDTKNVQFEQTGLKLRRIPLPDWYTMHSSNVVPATSKFIAEHPDRIARFGRALTKGFVACEAAIENCIRAFWKSYPELAPAAGTEETAMKTAVELLSARLKFALMFPEGEPRRYGSFTDEDFTGTIKSLSVAGLITDTSIPLDSLYTNQFVDEYNAFDMDKVLAEAKAYKP